MECRLEQSLSFRELIMERLSANSDDGGGDSETPMYSTLSTDSFLFCRTNSATSEFSDPIDDRSFCSEPSPSPSPSPSRWPTIKSGRHNPVAISRLGLKLHQNDTEDKIKDADSVDLEVEMMKERFAKLLLGEDMSGSGKGVCTAVTISNSITNLYATIFGHNLRLEPLKPEKKTMWRREMACLLSVCDYIVEFLPTLQTMQNGTSVEIMANRPRSDISINLPALKKLDAMLLETLDGFQETEFWYAESGSMSSSSTRSGSFRRVVHHKEEKWWLPVPCVPSEGLSDNSRNQLRKKRDTASQIHKAAFAINSSILDEMDIPDSYITSLPKCGRSSAGDSIYRYMTTKEKFCPDHLLDNIKIRSDHEALELADRVEASMYTWRRKACLYLSKPSWTAVKDYILETGRTDKNHTLAERAESLLFCLKQRFPELSQTSLDICKIQYNKDVGQAVLESYSRVLEGLAFNIVAWIEDVLHVDRITLNPDN